MGTAVKNDATAAKVSFFSRVEAELKKLFAHAPGWEASAAATLTYVAPLVEGLVVLIEPEAAPAVSGLIAKIQSAMAAAAVVIKEAGPSPTLITYLNAVTNDLAQILPAAQLKDPVTAQKVTATVSTITLEVNDILAALASASA